MVKAIVVLSKREKIIFFMVTSLLVIASAMYVGERFQPFKIAENVADYTANQVSMSDSTHSNVPTQTHVKKYVVKKGDTVWGISKKFGVHPETLKFANYLGSNNKIAVGQKLTIPERS